MMRNISSLSEQKNSLVFRLAFLMIAMIISFSVSASQNRDAVKDSLNAIEIAGVSLNTPAEAITKILQAQDYVFVNEAVYTKQEPAPNGRSTVYRIEIEDTPAFRQLSYSRNLTGGRNKSPSARDAAIPADEMTAVQRLYDSVCAVSEELQTQRACVPPTPANIIVGHGQLIAIDQHHSILLKASDASTSMMIRFMKKP